MPRSSALVAFVVGALLGAGAGAGAGYLGWGRHTAELAARITALEAETADVQGERERLHGELSQILRERREMANTAEHLRAQVAEQLRRLEALAREFAPPSGSGTPVR